MPPEKIVSPPDLRAFFARLVLPGFAELGIADRAVSDYVIDLLARFARTDQLYRAVEIRRYVGDYALFSSGLFRAWVEWQGLGDYYCEQGRAAYAAAAEMAQLSYGEEARLLRALGEGFEHLAGALDYVRKVHMRPESHGGEYGAVLREIEAL